MYGQNSLSITVVREGKRLIQLFDTVLKKADFCIKITSRKEQSAAISDRFRKKQTKSIIRRGIISGGYVWKKTECMLIGK